MLLLLVRHAVTAHTGDRLTGWLPGVGLSEEGRRQVDALVERVAPVRLAAVYSSPIQRTMETARPIARAKRLRVRTKEDLGEVRYGDWQGKRLRALARTRLWKEMRAWPSNMRFPGGENLRETQARAVAAVEEIKRAHPGGTVAAVTHADVVRLVAAHYAGMHIDLYGRLVVSPGSVSALWLGRGGPVVLALNSTGDLAWLAAPPARSRRPSAKRGSR